MGNGILFCDVDGLIDLLGEQVGASNTPEEETITFVTGSLETNDLPPPIQPALSLKQF